MSSRQAEVLDQRAGTIGVKRRYPPGLAGILLVVLVGPSPLVAAQPRSVDDPPPMVGAPAPPAPIPPEVVARNPDGGVTVRAVRLAEPLRFDGRLDEGLYSSVPAITDFVQQDPDEGEPATERTEAWIFFDNRNIYVSARCWDSHPEREIGNEMRRDGANTIQNENFAVVFDTFYDKRNGFGFQLTKVGGLLDVAVTDERDINRDWNAVWDARTAMFENGWTVEMVIPFKALRYKAGPNQVWGFNLRRIVRWKNEWSYLTRIPSFLGTLAMFRVSLGATLVGLEVPPAAKNFEIKPYAISGLRTDRSVTPAISNDADGDVGFDIKYSVTKSLTADFTYNTDFAQVEADEQQVNLTRFSLLYPEKRDFFLEGQGIFTFGGVGAGAGRGPLTISTPVMFFSRRIGLNNGRAVPIRAGGRMTGKVGKFAIGLLNLQSEEDAPSLSPATNFSIVRVKRDFLGRSNFGAIYTRRSVAAGAGETFGVDSWLSISPSLNVNGYLARTRTPGLTGKDASYLGRFDYDADRYGALFEHLLVGSHFNPEVGFLRRTDVRRQFAQLRFSPRPGPSRMKAVRKFNYQGSFEHLTNTSGRLEAREVQGTFSIDLQNSDRFSAQYSGNFEFIPQPFAVSTNVTVPVGGYSYGSTQASYALGAQRKISGQLSYEGGSLYGGTKQTVGYSRGRIELSPQFSLEPGVSVNWVDLPEGKFTSTVVTTRSTFTVTPRMLVSALIQFNSSVNAVTSNVRFRWEYQPGSELFLVYSDARDTLSRGFPALQNQGFVVKITRLFRF